MFPVEKYRYYVDERNRTVIAVSTYAGKTVKGLAKCDPRDEFDIEKGKELAAARCAEKIANKRLARASKKIAYAQNQLEEARKYYSKMFEYFSDAQKEASHSIINTQKLLDKMN